MRRKRRISKTQGDLPPIAGIEMFKSPLLFRDNGEAMATDTSLFVLYSCLPYILKTPNLVSAGSFFPPNAAIKLSPSTLRVWLGGITPSSYVELVGAFTDSQVETYPESSRGENSLAFSFNPRLQLGINSFSYCLHNCSQLLGTHHTNLSIRPHP